MLRTLVATAVLAAPAVAHADSFLEILGGLSIPIADSAWTDTAESSPKLELRAGAMGASSGGKTKIGGMLQADWTAVTLDNAGGSFGNIASTSIAAHRFRILPNLVLHTDVAPKLMVLGRVGIGIDIDHASIHNQLGTFTQDTSDTDVGFGFEVGGGIYYNIGSAQLGGELAIPIGHHSKKGNNTDGNYNFDWTSWDIELLVGVRLTSG